MQILVATTNPGKMAELSVLLGDLSAPIDWLSLRDFPAVPEVEEDGATFAANARKKALGYAAATGRWTLADDSGLVIDALDGAPGVYSARYAAEECPDGDRPALDAANIRKVLRQLADVPAAQRTARFQCCLCLAGDGEVLLETAGTVEGRIIDTPAGDNGFGYDPIFYIPECRQTAAQLEHDHKNTISHRGNAIARLKPLLETLLKNR